MKGLFKNAKAISKAAAVIVGAVGAMLVIRSIAGGDDKYMDSGYWPLLGYAGVVVIAVGVFFYLSSRKK